MSAKPGEDRSTTRRWRTEREWLRPLRDHLLDTLKRSGKLFADETVASLLDLGRGRIKRGQLRDYARTTIARHGPAVAWAIHARSDENHDWHVPSYASRDDQPRLAA